MSAEICFTSLKDLKNTNNKNKVKIYIYKLNDVQNFKLMVTV